MKKLLLLLAILLAGVVLAHAELESTTPKPNSTVTEPLDTVSLDFTEAVEVRFSLFKVYKLELPEDFDPDAENAELRLNGLAGALVAEVLEKSDDQKARADTGVTEARTGETITLALEEDLAPGHYVVMWRVLSVDTHGTQGFYVFQYAPAD